MKIINVLLFLGASLGAASLAHENGNTRGDVHSCTELLPPDQQYHLVLSTTIDTGQKKHDLNWSIKMDDGKGEEKSDFIDDEKDKRIEPFIECLINVVQ